ncbi:hypothetical protein ACFV2E_09875 [Streptomyces globisporus]|uniref:hypothetical protein n=1 Tax=Streptomyces globisporus TaxID=1908 RepID=UPI00368AE6E3
MAVAAVGLFVLGLASGGKRPSLPRALAAGALAQTLLHQSLVPGHGNGTSHVGHQAATGSHDVWHARVADWPWTGIAHGITAVFVAAVLCWADDAVVRAAGLAVAVTDRLRARLPGPHLALPVLELPVAPLGMLLVRPLICGRVLRGTMVRRGP